MNSWRNPVPYHRALRQRHFLNTNSAWRACRPRVATPTLRLAAVRCVSLEAGEGKSGHISAGPNEGILFFDNVFPLKLQWLLRLPFIGAEYRLPELFKRINSHGVAAADPEKILSNVKAPVNVTEILPRIKEGGAFVKFSHDAGATNADVESAVKNYLKETQIKPWFNPLQPMRAGLVKGVPWVEDLYRVPSTRVKVEFLTPLTGGDPAELSQEQLYSFFRPYGKLMDIVPQPQDSKVLPKYAFVDFARVRRAIMAKNCLHGLVVPEAFGGGKAGTLLRLSYEQKIKAHWIRDWIFNHPRIVIPILAAIIAGITVAVFDPIRTWFIKAHITRAFHLGDYKIVRWLRSQAGDIFNFRHRREEPAGMDVIWDDRKANITQIQTWLMETADTFIIIQGPRGSGKREAVDQAIKHHRNKLIIDCKPIQESRGDSATINAAAAEVGYRPVFSWMNSISGWVDLATQASTGLKAGFSETLDTQLSKIWNNTAAALKKIALEARKKDDKDANLTDDEYLEVHPERRPIVVIDNFLHKSQDSTTVYDKMAEWAAGLTTANIAHVIFLTHDVSFSKSLSKALPDRVFRQLSLSDCSPDAAKRFVISHLDADADDDDEVDPETKQKLTPSQRRRDLAELDSCILTLGGRLTDLEFLARRIKAGESPSQAVREIVAQSASEILKMHLYGTEERKWSAEQAWLLIKQLAASDSATLRYNEVLLSDTYKTGGEAVLQALEQAELISIASLNGRPMSIKPGKPVYHAAFQRLTEDVVLRSKLDLAILSELAKLEGATIDKCETELRLLGDLPRQPLEVAPRVKYLLAKVAASQAKVEAYETQQAALKKVLQEEF